jgi:hypothetical protein
MNGFLALYIAIFIAGIQFMSNSKGAERHKREACKDERTP